MTDDVTTNIFKSIENLSSGASNDLIVCHNEEIENIQEFIELTVSLDNDSSSK